MPAESCRAPSVWMVAGRRPDLCSQYSESPWGFVSPVEFGMGLWLFDVEFRMD